MTARMPTVGLALALLLNVVATPSCSRAPMALPRPDGVPVSAVWVGGADGGVFVVCGSPDTQMSGIGCTVFNDATGDVLTSGRFRVKDRYPAAAAKDLKYSAFDGQTILLQNGVSLVPIAPSRPAGVPATAALAENGVWVDCRVVAETTYSCSLFLASSGQRFAQGPYRLETQGAAAEALLSPKIGTAEAIYLNSGAVLRVIP